MDTNPQLTDTRPPARTAPVGRSARPRTRARLTGGGTDGNEQLTTITGSILLVLLAVLGVTILQVRQLIWPHLFLGLLLIGPVALKLASTGYRFARYYTHDSAYRRKGPPEALLRLIAPGVVFSTVGVFFSGVVLLFVGPSGRGQWVLVHKATFIMWLGFTAIHVLGHLPAMPDALRAARRPNSDLSGASLGAAGRWIAITGALVGGLVLALVLIPQFAAWTAPGAFPHHAGGG